MANETTTTDRWTEWPATDDAELIEARRLMDVQREAQRNERIAMDAFQEAADNARNLMDLGPAFRDWQAAKERARRAEVAARRSAVCPGTGMTAVPVPLFGTDCSSWSLQYICMYCMYCGESSPVMIDMRRHGWDGEPR